MRRCLENPFLFECIYAKTTVFEHQMTLRVFDTQFGAQGMENIGETWYCLVPFLTQGGPFGVLVLVASKRVVLFFNVIPEGIPCRGNPKYFRFLYDPLLKVSIPPILNMGDDLEECKSNIFPIRKIVDRKTLFDQIQPFIYIIRIYQSFK
jgi:hypothetical protein